MELFKVTTHYQYRQLKFIIYEIIPYLGPVSATNDTAIIFIPVKLFIWGKL